MAEPHFSQRLWGYDRTEVDAFVERTATRMAEALSARTPDASVKEALDRLGEETSAILQHAHEIADELTARAEQEAAELTERSRRDADELTARSHRAAAERLEQAEREAAAIRQTAETNVIELDRELDALWQERQRLLDDIERISEQFHALASGAKERFAAEEAEEMEQPTVEAPAVEAPTVETPAAVVIRADDPT